MSDITVVRTNIELPTGKELVGVRKFLFECFCGFTGIDKKRWHRMWKTMVSKEPGEMLLIKIIFQRSSPYHRRHFKIEQSVFDAQERFTNFNMFRDWLKIGAAWVVWVPGAKGGIVPLPQSVSYAEADQEEFVRFHTQVMEFLRGEHAAPYLWKHLGNESHEMMDSILMGFNE